MHNFVEARRGSHDESSKILCQQKMPYEAGKKLLQYELFQ